MATQNATASQTSMELIGTLKGHKSRVTSIASPADQPNMLISGSRDSTVMIWDLGGSTGGHDGDVGRALRALTKHSAEVSDLTVSKDGAYVISSSLDSTMRLWDTRISSCIRKFQGHKGEVLSVALSHDSRQIVSGGADSSIKLWNTMGECKYSIEKQTHADWINVVRFSPTPSPLLFSGGADGVVKSWDLVNFQSQDVFEGHKGAVNTVNISPDGSLCASGGRDGQAIIWDVAEQGQVFNLTTQTARNQTNSINSLCFSPCNYWLTAATDKSILIWNLENQKLIAELTPTEPRASGLPWCHSLTWAPDGRILYAGTDTGEILVLKLVDPDIH